MRDRVLGAEVEYALGVFDSRGGPVCRRRALRTLLGVAKQLLRHLPDLESKGMFLENGGRFYIDYGQHPELCTPESTDPADIVAYLWAADAILLEVAEKLAQDHELIERIEFYTANVDYITRTTWGCHESFMHAANPRNLPNLLLGHLVSRIIYTGAGGFDNLKPGLEFVLSTRVPHMRTSISSDSTSTRGIYHTKNEPLCANHHRLHVLCGETLRSQTANWLRLGTTAIVVALAEYGVLPADQVRLLSPLTAMQAITRDPSLRTRVRRQEDSAVTAIELQRIYLQCAEAHLDLLPEWAEDITDEWRNVLDKLESDPDQLNGTLDWRIKWDLYREFAQDEGVDLTDMDSLNELADREKEDPLRGGPPEGDPLRLLRQCHSPESPLQKQIRRLREKVQGRPAENTAKLAKLRALQSQLYSIDMRFGQLGEAGIFNQMDAAGELDHVIFDAERVKRARTTPPERTRAKLRGEMIQKYGQTGIERRYRGCTWSEMWDLEKELKLDLSDPFEQNEEWVPLENASALLQLTLRGM